MTETASAVYATYPESVALSEVLQTLEQGGIDKGSICVLLSPRHPMARIVRASSVYSYEREADAASAAFIGSLSEYGALVIPTFGLSIRSGEFVHALTSDRDSNVGCGSRETLACLGFSEEDAARIERHVRQAGALLYVSCVEADRQQWVLGLLRTAGADEASLLESEGLLD